MSSDVEAYFESAQPNRKEKMLQLRGVILEHFPLAKESMAYKMPTYEFENGWVAIANQKNYVSLYTCGEMHLESFKAVHPKIKTGKGCINFKDKDVIPIDDVVPVIKSAMSAERKK